MKVVNCWLGRTAAPPLLALFLAATTQAACGMESIKVESAAGFPAAAQASQTVPPSASQSQAPADPAQPGQTQGNPAAQPEQAAQSAAPQQTPSAPIVRQPAPAAPQNTNPPSGQATPSAQQYTQDQQYTTPAANQQLEPTGRRPLTTPSAASLPSAPPTPPVGTAVAPEIVSTGTAGSRVAGAAVAPAKQRRIRVIVVRAALLVGAAVAIGTVVGASKASPPRAQ